MSAVFPRPAGRPQEAANEDATPLRLGNPVIELLRRYRAVFGIVWRHRHELAGPKRLSDELAFLPAALSLQETPVHPAPRQLALILCALFLIALAWSIFGRIDIVAVAPGRIVVSDRTKLIQPLERSVVQRILVKDGDIVRAGQLLVELDPTTTTADETSITQQLQAQTSEWLRTTALLQALANGTRPTVPSHQEDREPAATQAQLHAEWSDLQAKTARLDAEAAHRRAEIATVLAAVAKLEATLPMAQQREADFQRLTEQGFIAGHASQDKTRERIEQERDLVTQRARLFETQAGLTETERTRSAYLAEATRSLSERQAQAALKRIQLTQESAKATQKSRLTHLTAPVAGTVQQVAIHTPGGVVTEAQALMVIVPRDAQVTAEVVIDNKDIGFVNAGQPATIKLETFPYTKYGTVEARVLSVTADAVNDEKKGAIFPATLALQRSSIDVEGKRIALSPGMNLTAEVKTGERRVVEYLLSPVQKTINESMGER